MVTYPSLVGQYYYIINTILWLGGPHTQATHTVENAIKGQLIDCSDNVAKLKIIRRVFCIQT